MNSKLFRRYVILLVLAGVMIVWHAPAAWAGPGVIEQQIANARELYQSARFDEAIAELSSLKTVQEMSEKQRIMIYQLLGFASVAKGYYDQARDAVEKIIELDPTIQFDPDYVPPKMMKIFYTVWKEKRGTFQIQQQVDPGLKTMAILDFDNNSIGTDKTIWEPMGKGLAQMLITDLSKVISLKVIERERIQYILDELKLEKSEVFDQKTAVRIGQQLGVHVMLFGGFSKIDKLVRIDARLIKVETSELLKAEEITGKAEELISLVKELALKIAKNLDVELSRQEKQQLKQIENQSLEAALAYSEGLSLLDHADYKSALRKFQEALKYNPNYTAAQKKIDLIKPLVS
ncbi:hypothetical protein L0128_16955 [candidate division KSB1 bacterium]|nr:hypothetical protein [candidate division KSB1 bacterium]